MTKHTHTIPLPPKPKPGRPPMPAGERRRMISIRLSPDLHAWLDNLAKLGYKKSQVIEYALGRLKNREKN